MRLVADISALEKDVGWKPRVSFEKGIRETAEWVKKEIGIKNIL